MPGLDVTGFPPWLNATLFGAMAIVVWLAGTRVTRYADAIQAQTGLGEALVGMLLLGLVTALPELAVTITASWSGNAQLAVNNLLGGMALNIAILAAADALVRGEALSAALGSPRPVLQGAVLIVLLALAGAGTVAGTWTLLGAGVWSWLILAFYVLAVLLLRSNRARDPWVPKGRSDDGREVRDREARASRREDSLRTLASKTALAGAAILGAGYVLSTTGEALARQTGLGSSFFGAVFLALSTSLPEITIVFSSVRIGRYEMAMGDIFGANLIGLALLFIVDLAYRDGPVLAEAGRFATFAALLGVGVTALFLVGLVERSGRRLGRMGVDSLAVLAAYGGGLGVLYTLR